MKTKYIFLCFFILIFLIDYLDFNDRFLFDNFSNKNSKLDIEKIEHKKDFYLLSEIRKNLSGITYKDNTDTLFMITNSPRDIYEVDKNGNILRKIKLSGFRDTEDLTFIKDDMFAILDEELSTFFIVNISKNTKTISINDAIKKMKIDVKNFENFGLEGISYDRDNDKFFVVNERNPKKIISIKGFLTNKKVEIKEEVLNNNLYLSDFSAIYYDNTIKNLYVLSEESSLLGKIENDEFKKFLDFKINDGISHKIKNVEGITKDKEGNIYIVGEPNLFFSIKKI